MTDRIVPDRWSTTCYHRPDGMVRTTWHADGEFIAGVTMDSSTSAEMAHLILRVSARELTLRRWLRIWWERRRR